MRWEIPCIIALCIGLCARQSAAAMEIGFFLPTQYGEVMVVKNDGGIKNWTTYFPYNSVCHTDLNLKTWLVIRKIVGDHVLLTVDISLLPNTPIPTLQLSCPHNTETTMPLLQVRKRYDDYARAHDHKVFRDLN